MKFPFVHFAIQVICYVKGMGSIMLMSSLSLSKVFYLILRYFTVITIEDKIWTIYAFNFMPRLERSIYQVYSGLTIFVHVEILSCYDIDYLLRAPEWLSVKFTVSQASKGLLNYRVSYLSLKCTEFVMIFSVSSFYISRPVRKSKVHCFVKFSTFLYLK